MKKLFVYLFSLLFVANIAAIAGGESCKIVSKTDKSASIEFKAGDKKVALIIKQSKSTKCKVNFEDLKSNSKDSIDLSMAQKAGDSAFAVIAIDSKKSANFKICGLKPETHYYLETYDIDGATNQGDSFITFAQEPIRQAGNIGFANVTDHSMAIIWMKGSGKGSLIVMAKGDKVDAPVDGVEYKANAKFGSPESKIGDSYVVFSGQRKGKFEVEGLSEGKYTVQAFEYNGSGETINYNTSSSKTNPRSKSTGIPAPKAVAATNATESGFTAHWSKVESAETYLLDVSNDPNFKTYLPNYESSDVGTTTEIDIVDLKAGQKYYYRLKAKNKENISVYSNTITVELK